MPTVLIVDDDQKLLKMLQRTLVYEGLHVVDGSAVSANLGTASLTGIPGLTATVSGASFAMNKSNSVATPNAVLDFVNTATNGDDDLAAALAVPGTGLSLALDGDEGALVEVDTSSPVEVTAVASAVRRRLDLEA